MKNSKPKMLAAVAVIALTLGVAACTSAPPMTIEQPDLTFAQMQDVPLAVAKIEVFEEYKSPMGGANIEHEFATPPMVAARNLIQSKLKAAGDRQVLRVFIDDASVKSQKLPVSNDFMGTLPRNHRSALSPVLRCALNWSTNMRPISWLAAPTSAATAPAHCLKMLHWPIVTRPIRC